jgi:arylsulfate sulfotransferase
VVHYTDRGTILSMDRDDESLTTGRGNIILETTLAGDTLFYLRLGEGGFHHMLHHDLILTEEGNYLGITEFEVDSEIVDGLVMLDPEGEMIWEWDSRHDHPTDLENYTQPWANSVFIDEDGHYIVSFRRISQVWKLHRDTREVIWRLGYNGTIPLTGDDLFLLQHTAHFIEPDRLLLFDNGQQGTFDWSNFYRPYSRIAEYTINQDNHTVTDVFYIDLPEKYFAANMGSVQRINDAYIVGASTSSYVLHVSLDGNILGEMKFDHRFYRAQHIENFLAW